MTRRRIHQKPVNTAALAPHKKHLPSGLLIALAATLLFGGVPFALGKYIELNSPDPFDGGAYVYSAQRILNGARLWVDEFPSAQPGTLLCNIIGIKLFGFGDAGPNMIQMLLQLAGLAMLFYAVRRLFGNIAAAVSTSLAAIMLSAPVIAKFGNVKEQFMIPFAVVAACAFALHEAGGKKHWAVIAGAAAICPYYFKPTGIAVVVAIGLYLAVKLIFSGPNRKAVFLTIALWILGAAVGLLFPASLYIWQDVMPRFWRSFPVVLLEGIVLFSALAFAVFALIHYIPWRSIAAALRTVDRKLWKRGLLAIAVALIFSMTLIVLTEGADIEHDIPSFFRSIPCVRIPMQGWLFIKAQADRIIVQSGILAEGGYVGLSRQARPFSVQAPQVGRYYNAVGAVFYPALLSLLLVAGTGLWHIVKKHKMVTPHLAIAGFLALWWLVDIALTWVSPHSYEQYYLPLCASGAILFAYAVWRWNGWRTKTSNKIPPFAVAGAAGVAILMLIFPVFAGFPKSPDTAAEYKNVQTGQPERRRGFAQSLDTAQTRDTAPWQAIADHVRDNSAAADTLYVWGWFPGIYVRAQRMAPVPRAYEADMHVVPPKLLTARIDDLVGRFETTPPRFIVDTLKRHFPFDRPPFELWPIVPQNMFDSPRPRLLSADPREIEAFENAYAAMLRQRFGEDEALRFEAMKPFRDFIMTRYRFAGQFGSHMLFERKN